MATDDPGRVADKLISPAKQVEARSPEFRVAAVETAQAAIGELSPGCRIVGLTKGQFSLLDLVKACLASTGPADLILSTWVVGGQDRENLKFLEESGDIRTVLILTDRSYKRLQPAATVRLRSLFGDDAILVSRIHAKFALLYNDDWKISIRSSMNLNRNPRWEQFDIDDSAEIYGFFAGLVAEIARTTPDGIASASEDVEDGFWASGLAVTCGGEEMEEPKGTMDERVAQLAGLQFTSEQILVMMRLDDWTDELDEAYRRGQLIAEESGRKMLLAQADSGDLKAYAEFQKLIKAREKCDDATERPGDTSPAKTPVDSLDDKPMSEWSDEELQRMAGSSGKLQRINEGGR